jgi:hypothetical protein
MVEPDHREPDLVLRASARQIFHRVSPGAVTLMSLIEAPGVA